MAISSIHFAAGHSGYFDHNSREAHTNNAIFKDEKNYCSANKKEAFEIFNKELKLRTEAYLENHQNRKKLHSKTITHLSAIFNFNKDTTVEQAQAVCDYLENKLDTKVVQLAMHRDEGHIIEADSEAIHDSLKKEIAIKNYHGHIEMLGLDSKGNSIRRKLDKPTLREIQTDVANILGMERGRETSYTKEEYKIITSHMLPENEYATKRDYNRAFGYFAKELGLYKSKKAKRLDTYEYKEMAKQRGEAVKELEKELNKELASSKDLQEINKQLREELKEMEALRADYAQLEALNKDLKEQVKNKTLTIEELNNIINEYKQDKAPKTNESILNDKSIEKQEKEVLGSLKDDFQSELEANKKGLLGKSYEVKLKEEFSHSPNVESLTLFMRVKKKLTNAYDIIKAQAIKILNLETENKSLKKENDKLSRELREAEQEIKELSKEKLEHSPLNSEKKETALDKLVTNYEKSKLEINKPIPKDKTLEEILNSPVKKEDLNQATKDLKAYIKKETPTRRLDMQK